MWTQMDMIGTSVDRYRIVEELGQGGMSVVYRGLDSALERDVAVKVLHNHLAKKAENRQRFHREAKAIARLRHPNILEIYDFSSAEADRSYIVMEYVQGENLRQYVGRTDSPPPEVAALICIEIANALEHAHDHGIIHRDLKPENVMVSTTGSIKLMDFGIAHVIDAETMTATGSLMGSPAHMAPEIIDGHRADVRADVFALGTVLYWLAVGRLPFEGANAPQVLRKVLEGDFEEAEVVEPRVGQRLGDVIRRCLATDPDDRYQTIHDVREALVDFIAPMGWTDYELELRRYLLAPVPFREAFHETIVEQLTQRARAAQRRRDVPEAIALFNRILAYSPDNREVQRLLDSLCRRASVRRALPWLVGALLVLAGVGGAVKLAMDRAAARPEPQTPAVVLPVDEIAEAVRASERRMEAAHADAEGLASQVAAGFAERATIVASSPVAEPSPRPVLIPPTLKARPIAPVTLQPAPEPAPKDQIADEVTPPARHIYRFSVVPAGATFYVDGRLVEVMKARSGIELPEGEHTLTATSSGSKRWVKRINVSGPQPPSQTPMPIVLTYEDAKVTVVSNVSAVVWFDSQPMRQIREHGRNATFTVPFGPADSTESTKQITLKVASAMDLGHPKVQTIAVSPGQKSSVTFNFDANP